LNTEEVRERRKNAINPCDHIQIAGFDWSGLDIDYDFVRPWRSYIRNINKLHDLVWIAISSKLNAFHLEILPFVYGRCRLISY
jgi:hypothetical protein